jgi:hypothetical protein
MRKWQKPLIGVGLGAALGPAVLSMVVTPTRAQPPSRVEVKETPVTKSAESPTAGQGLEPQAGPFQEELELLGLQVETERAQLRLAESRLEQAKRWESHFKELAGHGRVPIEQLIAAKDSVLRKESDAIAQRAVLKAAELRLAQAQRGTSSDRSLLSPSERRLADVERRLEAMERAVRSLRYETEHIELALPIKASSGGQ